MPTECSSDVFGFSRVEGRSVVAAFDGGAVTSDAGALLLDAADRAVGLVNRLAACFEDAREHGQVVHEMAAIVGQRVFGIALGYEDVNDHDTLVLICALRRLGLRHTQFAAASCGTIRLKLLKIGAQVRVSVRRVKLAMSSAHPRQGEWALAHARLTATAAQAASFRNPPTAEEHRRNRFAATGGNDSDRTPTTPTRPAPTTT